MAPSASAAPSSLNAVSLKAKKSGVGSPASRMRVLGDAPCPTQRMQADDARAGVGEAERPRAAPAPCRPRRRGRAARRRRRRAPPRAAARRGRGRRRSPITSWPRRSSASSTRAPERSETWRSSERPPLRTATAARSSRVARAPRRRASRAAARARRRGPGRRRGAGSAARRRRRAGQRAVELDLLAHDLADPAHALADVVLARRRRSSAASTSRRGRRGTRARPGHERDVARSARASRSVVSM